MQPSMVQVLRYWVPPTERNHFMWAYCGKVSSLFLALVSGIGVIHLFVALAPRGSM